MFPIKRDSSLISISSALKIINRHVAKRGGITAALPSIFFVNVFSANGVSSTSLYPMICTLPAASRPSLSETEPKWFVFETS